MGSGVIYHGKGAQATQGAAQGTQATQGPGKGTQDTQGTLSTQAHKVLGFPQLYG